MITFANLLVELQLGKVEQGIVVSDTSFLYKWDHELLFAWLYFITHTYLLDKVTYPIYFHQINYSFLSCLFGYCLVNNGAYYAIY